jgi:aldehyde:ferredoxin oxidoreductase
MTKLSGWAGKILRVNLTNGDIKTVDTMKYKDYVGSMGIGQKVMFDEVPAGTHPYDTANKIIIGAGPLSGSGVPCSSRTHITSLLPSNPYHAVSGSHMGGHFAAMLKYAGWDAIIIEGTSPKPVWLRIEDDRVTIEDASFVWGTGINNTTAQIAGVFGKEASIAAIGQAGENLVNLSVIMNSMSHSAGGHGAVFGSKRLKAIAVRGTGSVKVAGKREELLKLYDDMLKDIIGANNQHVVPRTPQPWAEYYDSGSRWTAKEGLYWGAAQPPIETGVCAPGDIGKIGFRTMKASMDLGAVGAKYTVRMGGCQSCPIRCHSYVNYPNLEKYGMTPYAGNTCLGFSSPNAMMIKGVADQFEPGDAAMVGKLVGSKLADDYGVWCNYSAMAYDFKYAYNKGIIKKVLPKEEYDSIQWDLLEKKDPRFLIDLYRRIALKIGELSHLGDGTYWLAKRWNFGPDYYTDPQYNAWSKLGFPKHHSSEAGGQVGTLVSTMMNRDGQNHTHMNFIGSGLPINVLKEIAAKVWGSGDAIDEEQNYTPMNVYKAKFAKWSCVKLMLHNSLTLCNWMWPMTTSPKKERNYMGDTALEAKFMSIVTGENYTEQSLDLAGERIFTLHRASTVKYMKTVDMRNQHDSLWGEWVFDRDPDKKAFTPGTIKMDRDDMQLALTMFYKELGWDEKTGAPTRATLERLGMKDVADQLQKLNLLP